MKPIRTALIGYGRWGHNLARNLREHAAFRLKAIWDVDSSRFGVNDAAVIAPDAASAIRRDDIDAVVIATPPETHFELARQALSAGKHVLCEKPLALAAAECEELGNAAKSQGRCLMVDCTPVYLDEIQAAKETIDFPSVRHVCCLRTSSRTPESLEQLVWDLAPHDLAVLHYWFGRLPEEWKVVSTSERRVELYAQYTDGPSVEVIVGSEPKPSRQITIREESSEYSLQQRQSSPEPLRVVVSHFADCIHTGSDPITGADGAAEVARALAGLKLGSIPHTTTQSDAGLNSLTVSK